MPVTVVAGGQYGSEGKGKISLHIARHDASVGGIIRVGGSNSGHTGVTRDGRTIALRQLPAGAIDGEHHIFLPAGSYIDVDILLTEIDLLGYDPSKLTISPFAHVITDAHKAWERDTGLRNAIGSTESGTGAAVLSRVARGSERLPPAMRAEDHARLAPFIGDTTREIRDLLDSGRRVIIEGTQGFGLSMLHADAWPKATSRDTTAAGFLAEAGLSPLDVDDVTLVLRCHPIRVAGRQSGPLPCETSWEEVARRAAITHDITEYTTVTRSIRRVGAFDYESVRQAISVNRPTRIVLNHVDYISPTSVTGQLDAEALAFVDSVSFGIGQQVDWVGTSPSNVIELQKSFAT